MTVITQPVLNRGSPINSWLGSDPRKEKSCVLTGFIFCWEPLGPYWAPSITVFSSFINNRWTHLFFSSFNGLGAQGK